MMINGSLQTLLQQKIDPRMIDASDEHSLNMSVWKRTFAEKL